MQLNSSDPLENRPAARTRQAGALDVVDLVVGLVLVIIMPFAVMALSTLFTQAPARPIVHELGSKQNPLPPEDAEEIETRWQLAEKAYRSNAKPIFKRVEEAQDSILRETLRVWAVKALRLAESELTGFKSTIEKPELASKFSAYQPRIQSLKKEIQADLARLKELNTLDRPE